MDELKIEIPDKKLGGAEQDTVNIVDKLNEIVRWINEHEPYAGGTLSATNKEG